MSHPRRLGRLTVDADLLHRALGIPQGHRIVEVGTCDRSHTFELVVEGPDMPPVSPAGVPAPVQLHFRRSRVTASWSHKPDEVHEVAPYLDHRF